MDPSFHNLCVSANPKSATFWDQGKSILNGETGLDGVACDDTTLRLDFPGFIAPFSPKMIGSKRKWSSMDESGNQHMGSLLDLSLRYSSSSSETKESTTTSCTSASSINEVDDSSMDLELDFILHLGGEKSSDSERYVSYSLKSSNAAPMVDLELSLFSEPAVSEVTKVHSSHDMLDKVTRMITDSNLDTDKEVTGRHFSQSEVAKSISNVNSLDRPMWEVTTPSPSFSSSITTAHKISVTCSSGVAESKQQCASSPKKCQFIGCVKGARGASGLCIAHGGGRRCQHVDCHIGAEGRTAFCKAHGGGRRCESLGCTKSAEGRTDFCVAHGGGRRCSHEGCIRASSGKSGLCIRHGGGKRCQRVNCAKSAEGISGLCISHGGGRRCQYPECKKGAQGSTKFCNAYGGGKRCTCPECQKGAEGSTSLCKGHGGVKRCSFEGGGVCPKSVHGGTLFCVAHGGGERCTVPECTKSARGRTNFCFRHGGGKRCQQEGCGKSAQGSTDFCKSQGEGKRCSWGHPCSDYSIGEDPRAWYTTRCEVRVHGHASNETAVHHLKAIRSAGIKLPFSFTGSQMEQTQHAGNQVSPDRAPEGRVHGGNLIAAASGRVDSGQTINVHDSSHLDLG